MRVKPWKVRESGRFTQESSNCIGGHIVSYRVIGVISVVMSGPETLSHGKLGRVGMVHTRRSACRLIRTKTNTLIQKKGGLGL